MTARVRRPTVKTAERDAFDADVQVAFLRSSTEEGESTMRRSIARPWAFISESVAKTVGKGMVDLNVVTANVILAGLLGGIPGGPLTQGRNVRLIQG